LPPESVLNAKVCVVCNRRILKPNEQRTIKHGNKEFTVHGACLVRLRRLLRDYFNITAPTPTITRALTLNEFLLTKRPSTDTEILVCLAYYHQTCSGKPYPISKNFVKEQLQFTGFKIQDIDGSLHQSTDQLGYFDLQKRKGKILYILTEKGTKAVERFPALND
jgi:hypothetical protein